MARLGRAFPFPPRLAKPLSSGNFSDLTASLVSYWSLNEASGIAIDSHGTNDLDDINTVASTAGKVDGARDFERDNLEAFTHASNTDLQTGDIDFTLQAWVNLESKPAGYMEIVSKYGDGAVEYSLYWTNSVDRFGFDLYDGVGVVGSIRANTLGAPALGTWYLIHAWHDAVNNQVGISVNAGPADTAATTGPAGVGAETFAIGTDAAGSATGFFDGLIDEVGLWKRVLTAGERLTLYNNGVGLAYAVGPVADVSLPPYAEYYSSQMQVLLTR